MTLSSSLKVNKRKVFKVHIFVFPGYSPSSISFFSELYFSLHLFAVFEPALPYMGAHTPHYTKFHLFQLQIALPLGFRSMYSNSNNCNGQRNSKRNFIKPLLNILLFLLTQIRSTLRTLHTYNNEKKKQTNTSCTTNVVWFQSATKWTRKKIVHAYIISLVLHRTM